MFTGLGCLWRRGGLNMTRPFRQAPTQPRLDAYKMGQNQTNEMTGVFLGSVTAINVKRKPGRKKREPLSWLPFSHLAERHIHVTLALGMQSKIVSVLVWACAVGKNGCHLGISLQLATSQPGVHMLVSACPRRGGSAKQGMALRLRRHLPGIHGW